MAKKKLDIKAAYEELEALTRWVERGEPDLEAGLEKYERATELVRTLQDRLQEAEQKIRQIRVPADEPLPDTLPKADEQAF